MISPLSHGALRPSMPVPPSPEQAFQHIDTTGKGYITEAELASTVVSISAEGSKLSQNDAQASAQEAFKKMDTNQDGKVTQSEFVAAAPPPPGGADGTVHVAPAGHAAGGHRGGGGPGGAAANGASDTSLTYAAADTNQDGTVSALEAMVYTSKHVKLTEPATSS